MKTAKKHGEQRWQYVMKVLGKLTLEEIFQADSFSPLIFILIPLSILDEADLGYVTSPNQKLKQLLFMDDLKMYAKCERELDLLIQTVRIFSDDVGMVFNLDKCAMLVMKKGKRWFQQKELNYQTKSV